MEDLDPLKIDYHRLVRLLGVVIPLIASGCSFNAATEGPSDGNGKPPDARPDAAIDALPIDGAPGSGRRKRITIDPARVTGSHAGFPVWIVLDDEQLADQALQDGSDIFFTRPDGTPLEHELQRWTKSTGHLEAWVRLDLDDNVATELDLRYGDPGPAHAPDPPMVFTSSFAAVWHLDDSLATTVVADARGAHTGAAIGGLGQADAIPGKLGRAIDFDGMNDEITFSNPLSGGGPHTISAWIDVRAAIGNSFASIMTVGNPLGGSARWLHTSYPELALGFYGPDWQDTGVSVDNNTWRLLHWVYDDAADVSRIYLDGVLQATSPPHVGMINTQGAGGHLGNSPGPFGAGGTTPNPLNGTLDEVRIATAVRTAGWIATEFANQSSPTTFYTVGMQQVVP